MFESVKESTHILPPFCLVATFPPYSFSIPPVCHHLQAHTLFSFIVRGWGSMQPTATPTTHVKPFVNSITFVKIIIFSPQSLNEKE